MATRADAPIVVEGAENFVERNYREGGRHQWVRETLVNSIEAGATRVEFGTEWQGVAERGVWRRVIADNGPGMTPDELLTFFRTYGGSGKPIGGIHENYGIGAKCSLFPWNTAGLVIVAWHVEFDEPSMIWVRKDPERGTYGLRTWDTDEGGENVVVAYADDELGVDWSLVKPDWIDDHGTVIVLLGENYDQDTVLGDPHRDEEGVPGVGIVNYLNRRMWDLDGVTVTVDEYRREDRASWPKTPAISVKSELQYGRRTVNGALYYIGYPPAEQKGAGKLAGSGTVPLSDGTKIGWYLWEGGGRDGIRNAAAGGYLAAQYAPNDNRTFPELFDIIDHPSRFRSFGISESDVRKRVWLVARPPLAGQGNYGVYMSSDRNRLLTMGGPKAGDPLPWDEWAVEFADNLPDVIVKAINDARSGRADTDLDAAWKERLAERFSRRWRQLRFIVDGQGDKTTTATRPGGRPRPGTEKHRRRAHRRASETAATSGRAGETSVGTAEGGDSPARQRNVAVGLPEHEWISDSEVFGGGIFAVWNPPSQANPNGLVQLNIDHPVLREEILFWAPQYPQHLEDDVVKVIKDTYAQMAVATVAHSESLRVHLDRAEDLDHKLRSPEALTAALLGLVGANAIIGPTLGGALGRRRAAASQQG